MQFKKTFLAIAALTAASSVLAQISIPNPLVSPPKKVAADPNAIAETMPPLPPGAKRARGAGQGDTGSLDNAPIMEAVPLGLKARLGNFYVAAVVGNSAILRQNTTPLGNQNAMGSSMPAGVQSSNIGQSSTPGAFGQGQGQASTAATNLMPRLASISVKNGELVEFFEDYPLLARVDGHRVTLYLAKDNTKLQAKGKMVVVFSGSVESASSLAPHYVPATASLEKPDTTYRDSVSVSQEASNLNSSSTTTSSAPGTPASTTR
jgi:hypothetical protein